MLIQIPILSNRPLDLDALIEALATGDIVVALTPEDMPDCWAFYRRGHSATLFLIERTDSGYLLSMDRLASYSDYRFMPYLLDTLWLQLCGEAFREGGLSAYEVFGEDWLADEMGEEIAYLKCYLALGRKYYLSLPIAEKNLYVDSEALARMGVCIHSSTPRIYGYTQYMLTHGMLPADDDVDLTPIDAEVDVPQHVSIATVLSWQTDGSETTESYCSEDVALLLRMAHEGRVREGVVMNDIGTLYEKGIGTPQDTLQAIHWYERAIQHGDLLYAPTNLGDIYRKGLAPVAQDLAKAVEAYRQSVDPYAWYRIGQSYEEGWTAPPDLTRAMTYYHKAATAGHHLALKRLSSGDILK